jgi:hypothetical protein
MIEGVYSVVANSASLRPNLEQISTSRSLTANPDRVQEVAQPTTGGPYYNSVDVSYDAAVILFVDQTGQKVQQIPTEFQLQSRQAREQLQAETQGAAIPPNTGYNAFV